MAVQGVPSNEQCRAVQGGAVKVDGLLESQHVRLRLVHAVAWWKTCMT